jgi:hypothetical protein
MQARKAGGRLQLSLPIVGGSGAFENEQMNRATSIAASSDGEVSKLLSLDVRIRLSSAKAHLMDSDKR